MKPAFDNIFCYGKGGSHDVDIILGGGLLNMMMLNYKVGRES